MPRAPSDTDLIFFVKLSVRPDRVTRWLEAVREVIEAMQHEDTFVSCNLDQDATDPCHFTLYERWAEPDVASFVRNQSKPYRLEYDQELEELLERPREPQILRPIARWPGRG
jgi:quinol monooxygenase YgiN